MLEKQLDEATVRAFADDIGLITGNWFKESHVMERLFGEFGNMSGLKLNIRKTVVIPCWPKGIDEVKEDIAKHHHAWKNMEVTDKGTYLGVVEGPGKGDSSWTKPLAKYKKRACSDRFQAAGLRTTVEAYNSFVITTLLYVAQLAALPKAVLHEEEIAVYKTIRGPGSSWMHKKDAWYMQPTRRTQQRRK